MKLHLEHIEISYGGAPVLRDFSLSLQEGEFVSLVGPSGCGKSTLLSVIAGTLQAERGYVRVDGETVAGISPHFSLMPQDDLLLPWLSVLDNVCLYGKVHGDLRALRTRAMESLSTFGLSGYEQSYPEELSGGMRQRAAFLRTALSPSDILLLDEPFASLDVITREEMQDWLLNLRRLLGRTVLLVTHDIEEAMYLSDRVLVLGGRPAEVRAEFSMKQEDRNRAWLMEQTQRKKEIYQALKGEV